MKETYKLVPHSWVSKKGMHKPMCSGCGLLRLRNKATDIAVKRGCMYDLLEKKR